MRRPLQNLSKLRILTLAMVFSLRWRRWIMMVMVSNSKGGKFFHYLSNVLNDPLLRQTPVLLILPTGPKPGSNLVSRNLHSQRTPYSSWPGMKLRIILQRTRFTPSFLEMLSREVLRLMASDMTTTPFSKLSKTMYVVKWVFSKWKAG